MTVVTRYNVIYIISNLTEEWKITNLESYYKKAEEKMKEKNLENVTFKARNVKTFSGDIKKKKKK